MTVKRFVAPDMRRALDLVREEMGPDAIILSSQRTAQGVEIITSLDTDLPTRGADTRKTFGQQFDEELDSPLESDAAWKTHQGMAQAAQKYRPQNTTAQTFGGDSAGTLPMSSERAKALADKIEQAREKMLAAKRVEQTQVQPDAYDRSTQDSIRQSRHSSGQNNNSPNSADRASNGYDSPAHNVSVKSARVRKEPVISEPLHRETTASYEPQMQTTAMVQNSPDIGCAPAVNSEPFCHNPPQEQMLSQDQILPPIHSEPDANFLADWQPDFYRNMPEVSEPSLDRQMAGLQAEVRQKAAEQSAAKHQESDANDRRLQGLQDQLADMRLLLEQQMWSNRDSRSAPKANSVAGETIVRNLEQMGLPSNVTQKLALTATPGKSLSAAWRESLALLTRKVPTVSEDLVKHGGVFAFVGPTGVGKTTTIAKLASRYVLEHGLGKVALITTDTYRVGAHDQLRSLGRILNVPVRVVDRERSLASVVANLKDYPLVLVDTAGFRHGDPLLKEQEDILESCPGLKRVLVLASNSQKQNLKASAHAYKGNQLAGCVLTKLDETASLGEAIGVIVSQKIPVAYLSDGQGIPKDIAVASAHNLVAKSVSLMKAQQPQTHSVEGA